MKARYVVGLLFLAMLAVSGCNGLRQVAGMPVTPEPTVNLKSAETRWLLIKNPRFGDVRSEPEYIWVEEDKLPTTMTTLLRGKSAIIAPPEVVAKYGLPPGGGKISPRQGVPYATVDPSRAGAVDPRAAGSAAPAAAPPSAPVAQAPRPRRLHSLRRLRWPRRPLRLRRCRSRRPPRSNRPRRWRCPNRPGAATSCCVEPTRIIIDLTAVDGLRAGSVVSLRRDTIPSCIR